MTGDLALREGGVLLHVSSVEGAHGIGDLGRGARGFVEWMARAGLGWWQMLPVGPVGRGGSPYSALSAFAGEELYVDLEALAREGLLEARELRAPARLGRGPFELAAARAFKRPRLRAAWRRFVEGGGMEQAEYRAFVEGSAPWLDDYARLSSGPEGYHRFVQFQFDRQWRALRGHAAARGVRLMGDVPIFVVRESVDVRAHPGLFRLDARGRPKVVTGVPPDLFSRTGQRWGHPHYDWPAHRRTRFRWWLARFERGLELFDALRVDHFIGFVRAYEIAAGARDARRGRWREAPGRELLRALERRRGALPIVAEDLGLVTPEVHALRDELGLPGMRVLQFAFGGDAYHLPHRHPERSVSYTGTHDNDTLLGWWRSAPAAERRRARAYGGVRAGSESWDLLRLAFTSPARLAIAPMQDFLALPSSARMNRPGKPRGNWRWRMAPGAATAALARRVRELLEASERLPPA